MGLLSAVFGDPNEKLLRKHYWPVVEEINGLEEELARLSDAQLRGLSDQFRQRLAGDETLDDLLPEAFAAVREAARRTIGLRHFDVQLIGGLVLHQGAIAEMKTGEGKTLAATLPLYLNALGGPGAHLVTVNDYLARRDAQWMGPIYLLLGLSLGVLQHDTAFLVTADKVSETLGVEHLAPASRRQAYAADITYGTNNEFGFDYLRDNMVVDLSQRVQRELHYAIVDEVDNILIDEARTPLIISGQAGESAQLYNTFARLVPRLEPQEHYTVDEKHRSVSLTEGGLEVLEKMLGVANIYAPENYRLTRFMEAALRARALYQQDRDYVVRDGEVIIVDEFTGRLMPGRRYSEGLHQAIEAKEGVQVRHESVTLATITLQNYFRLYEKLAGMTGTAATQAEEFDKIYKLEVLVIPTHRPMVRQDGADLVYRTEGGKFHAVVEEIEELHARGQPALVGTVSIEKSEHLADLLKRTASCDFADCRQYHRVCPLKNPEVLNAKHHEREAHIVAQAGRVGAVTIATNMAGRGTDIILGGNPEGRDGTEWEAEHQRVVEPGGLHIVGTERHEARRIDNQLRGRAGRQGDPGSSRFFVSFEDDIMRRFAPEWLPGFMAKLGMDEETPLESGMVTRAIEQAQTRVEGHNFDIRKRLVEYDDVVNQHRDTIYSERRKILQGADLRRNTLEMMAEEISNLLEMHVPADPDEPADREGLLAELQRITAHDLRPEQLAELSRDEVHDLLLRVVEEQYEARERELGPEAMRTLERLLMLRTIDSLWVEHLTAVDEMRQGIGLRAYGGTDPLVVYKREAHDMWGQLLDNIRHTLTRTILNATLTRTPARPAAPPGRGAVPAGAPGRPAAAAAGTAARTGGGVVAAKVGRNEPCPCGSGRKYKKCHGTAA